ncbi:OLC1v1027560C1 [Oldenlandia corymbosa var. corymbosa]|uniref:OLC1v1027560C1 n=1 Tax=Oldenlandia corymbosa var. corymbosa TaxID=529605 RepID=A0AAV1CRH0_OLDCO|nr:OLC1v1027560C1 [Oldenlandia corymbosa var. corymbosa]
MASSSSLLSAACKRLEGKVALITGAASGIGECTAKLFSKHGAKVVIADIQDNLGHPLTKTLGENNSTYVHCDVTNEDQVKNAVDKTIATYGKLDIMMNNAAFIDRKNTRIWDNETSDFERVLKVNVTGVFLGMKHAARVMVPARSGCIISTASMTSGMGGAATHAYTCSKHAVLGLTRNLAVELGRYGIRVNCLSPNIMQTPLARKFMGSEGADFEKSLSLHWQSNLQGVSLGVDDVANAALYLASDDAKCVSGHNLFIDGGQSICNSGSNMFAESEPAQPHYI